MEKSPGAFRTISEVAQELDLPQHVLRFWETRFSHIRPLKRGGGRRYYRPDDVELLRAIRHLLYGEGYTIKGVQRLLKERGVRAVIGLAAPRTRGAPRTETTAPNGAVARPVEPDAANGAGEGPREEEPPWTEDADAGAPAQATGRLSRQDFEQLRAALTEIAECERILAAAQSV